MNNFFLDCLGLRCPDPLTMIRSKMRTLNIGDTLEVLSDDPVSQRDIPAYCKFMGHELTQGCDNNQYKYNITKCK
ncbi:Sulfurtransferase TusA [Anaerobiospirillum thomasii]|uniref:Sulfurtransferase TusA n=1 Tax=Anaerobiospirillum thomasii TaxID=179995 RepID=A0A2X0X114_9GAMM|nr:sulfurtransferase TusA [Anaerobiospirillum thomasii]SPT69188.1 Sulfurtransferase TusA [Anaerobiospirillum thomasii]SPT72259.1 Sulfurtransferase TusA [Anaerobiospirillum thomasii]SPT72472.1 Sulfurtransferase TusA [Anaerobiospirillum thomasii]